MAADRRQLLSDSSASAVSLQYSPSVQPLYPSLSDTRVESALHLPGSAIAEPADTVVGSVEEDSVSLSSSISTTTDDQAALLRKDRLNSLEGPLASAAGGSDGGGGTRARRIKSAAVSSKRKRGGQHLSSEELERTAPFTASVPRTGGWNSEPESDDESKSTTSSVGERTIKSAALLLSGRSRVRVAPAPLGNEEDNHSQTSSTNTHAWEPLQQDLPSSTISPLASQTTSQTSLTSSGTKGPPLYGRAKVRVSPAAQTEEAEDATNSITSSRGTLNVFVSDGVAVEEATGEAVVEVKEEHSAPYCVEHRPYIPLQSAQEALTRVTNDMQRMKEEHIELVECMQNAYREIEEESKVQYKEYVQQLRKQHGSKMSVYKQVVKLLQEEMEKMKEYWEGTAKSLASNNRNLLLENKNLYQQLKDGVENMKQEKEKMVRELTGRIETESKRRETDKKKAEKEIDSLQTKCTDMVRLTEIEAEQKLAREKVVHEQLKEELEKRLAKEQARLRDLERSLALERASSEGTKVIVKKGVEAVPVLTHPIEPQLLRMKTKGEKVESQLSHAEEVKLKKKVGTAEKELRLAQVKLKSMMSLLVSEPGLRDALEERMEEVGHEIDALREERDELKEQLVEKGGSSEEELDRKESGHEMDKTVTVKRERLSVIIANLSQLEEKLKLMQFLQKAEGTLHSPVSGTAQASKVAQQAIRSLKDNDNNKVVVQEEEIEPVRGEAVGSDGVEGEDNAAKVDSAVSVVASEEEEEHATATAQESEPEIDQEVNEKIKESSDEERESDLEDVEENADLVMENEEVVEPAFDDDDDIATSVNKNEEKDDDEVLPNAQLSRSEKESVKPYSTKPATKKAHSQQPSDPKLKDEMNKLREQVNEFKKQQQTDKTQIKSLQKELKVSSKVAGSGGGGGSVEEKRELKKKEKELKDLSRQNETAKKNLEKIQAQLKTTDSELTTLKKDHEKLLAEMKEKNVEFQKLSSAAKNAVEAAEKAKLLEEEVKKQAAEMKTLAENYNSERVLRKKYYNLIEDMKGKIRVYCRARPLSGSEKARNNFSVIESPDEYTLNVKTSKGVKEFQFDQVFTPEHSQTKVFEDTKNLIQSAVDGYNVCIFAYGQTGSGKTYTMIGGKDGNNQIVAPGIAPRAFETIFKLIDGNKSKFSFTISCYMLELYNDKLLDLFQSSQKDSPRLDIKKDKKGLVMIHGAIVHHTDTAAGLMDLFELGSKNRHVSSTKMNAESSRSHLVVGIVIESTNVTNGTVHRGKLSIVDLAGSERASKTGATPEQLKEAQSINKSLSALGDVISALSSGQEFIPYRNNKLTMLMQDSLGGNAKTLMFVNISPADYNAEETVVSLTYAARVKLITNDASKNADNKEIARLKGIISRLKKGEEVEDDS